MTDRLSPLDASFLYLEEPTTAMHVGSVMILEAPGSGVDYDSLVALASERIGELSRYRQRVRELPAHIAGPVWVDDAGFDLTYHVRRSALPRPGTDEQLAEFVARIQSRPLDRHHPLWEIYLVEGLQGGRSAIITKTHQALVDGITAVDIGHLLLDDHPETVVREPIQWAPRREPNDIELVAEVLLGFVRRPLSLIEQVRGSFTDFAGAAGRALRNAGGLVTQVARTAASPAPTSALNTRVGAPRRFRMINTDLADFREVREALATGGRPVDVSINDVALAVIAGGLRTWLQSRAEPVHSATTVRAMVPISISEGSEPAGSANRVAACFVDLPVGEPNGRLRLERIAYQTRRQTSGDRAVGAETIAGLAGFAPSTLHHLGARLGNAVSRRLFNLVVTNVPGPQHPLYVGGARMVATYPVMPLALGQSLAIGLTSYDGDVYIGLNGDRASMPDLDVLGDALLESLDELISSTVNRAGGRS